MVFSYDEYARPVGVGGDDVWSDQMRRPGNAPASFTYQSPSMMRTSALRAKRDAAGSGPRASVGSLRKFSSVGRRYRVLRCQPKMFFHLRMKRQGSVGGAGKR